jgi:hypothetical protein
VGRAAFKKGSIPRAVAMSSHSPHASRPSTFRVPRWGAPALPSSCCCWRSATLWGLAPFSHRSASRIFIMQPGCIPSPMVIQDDDHQFGGGEKQAGLRPLLRPQLQGSSSSELGRRAGVGRDLPPRGPASRFFLRHSGDKGILQLCGGGVLQPCGGRRTAAAGPGCSCPSSTRATVAGCTRGSHNTSYAVRVVLVFQDGPILVLVARGGVRTYRCALGRPPLAGAVLVGRWPLSSVLRWWSPASHLEFVVPQALWCGGCSYPREWNRSLFVMEP